MKTTIFVYSGTGTSLAVAKKIAIELGNTELVSIAKYSKQDIVFTESERVGFIFPCNFGEVPHIVRDFIEKVQLHNAQYIFSIITAGGNAGVGLKILNKLLEKKGETLNYGRSLVIASNYIVGWYNGIANSRKAKTGDTINESNKKIMCFSQDIKGNKNYVEKGSNIGYVIPHLISSNKIIRDSRPWDRDFSAGEKCDGCGICTKVCPVQNIKLTDKKPEYMHHCLRCMACLQYCPQGSIKYKGKYIKRARYHYPDISVNEISEFNL